MMKFWIVCAVAAALAGCASGGGAALPATGEEQRGVAGEWAGYYTGTGGEHLTFYLTLKQQGEFVTGTYSNPGYGPNLSQRITDRPVSGSFRDGVLAINFGEMSGTVTGNTWSGYLRSAVGVVLYFTATRAK
jgi:hypothetical protein